LKKLLLVDFYALMYRSRNALLRSGRELTTSLGTPVTGAYGFTNNLISQIKDLAPTHVAVCYDAGANWRKVANEDYKANRVKAEGADADAFKAEARLLLDDILPAMGISTVGILGYEADDTLYTLSKDASDFDEVIIFTCDQDILQCVTDKVKVRLFNTAKKVSDLGPAEVEKKWGVRPQHLALVKALCGDGADNIKGIRGIGPKTAAKIVCESYGVLDNVLKNAKVEPYKDLVLSNLELTRSTYIEELKGADFSQFSLGSGKAAELKEVFEGLEFNALLKRFSSIGKILQLSAA
jgi:DNA polymerase-1